MSAMSISGILLTIFILPFLIAGITLIVLFTVMLIRKLRQPDQPEIPAENIQPPANTEAPDEPAVIPSEAEKTLTFPESLKKHRTDRHMSQEYLAEQLGVTRQAVSKWESGTSEPSTANLIALAKLYGISLDELAGLK